MTTVKPRLQRSAKRCHVFLRLSETFELVGVLSGKQITLYLDRFSDNSPVRDAQIELEIGSAKFKADKQGEEEYEVVLPDVDKLVEIIAALEPSFGAINLEDIKAPDCFAVERRLRERLSIPVFHDDQHGTAIVVGAALLNALKVAGKAIGDIKVVASGAGAAALACLGMLVKLGVPQEHIWVSDLAGVVWQGRTELMDDDKARYAQPTELRTLAEVIVGADVCLGLSAGGVLKPEMVATMAARPVIFALANP